MKSNFLLVSICVLAFAFSANATTWTVNNNGNSPGQYTSIQAAVNAASSGDSIYVEPSPNDYGSFSVPRKLFIFGGGGDPYTYQANNRTIVDGVTFTNQTTFPVSSSSGSQIEGFYIGSGISVGCNLSNITMLRNEIPGGFNLCGTDTNMIIINNVISSGQVYFTSSFNNDNTILVANNFFINQNAQAMFENNGGQDQETGVQFINNVVYNSSTGLTNSGSFFRTLNNASIKNNIFYCQGGTGTFNSGCNACTFENNITYSPNCSQILPDGNNTGTGNINNTNPAFVAGPAVYTVINVDLLYNYNWHLTNSSPGHLSGSDGTDIGIYGGPYPFANFETITRLPQMRFLEINNPTVQPGGTLHVNVIGTTHN
jgi:hypothetical protein